MEPTILNSYTQLLKDELVPALGCTEPIAVAYATAYAVKTLGVFPDKLIVGCSGNVIKNVKGVIVPNSDGQRGIKPAAILGALSADPDKKLEVLSCLTKADIERGKQLQNDGICECHLIEGVEGLLIEATACAGEKQATVVVANEHTNVVRVTLNGVDLLSREESAQKVHTKPDMSVRSILEYAETVDIKDISELLDRQIELNSQIADEGLSRDYGVGVGKNLLQLYGEDDVRIRARARAAAASDARMGGCVLPVVINSGSGNQGITVSLPVVEYAKTLGSTREQLYRALAVANLTAIHQKSYIGSLSAFCGAVCAAAGAAAGIAHLYNATYEELCACITNTVASVGGMVCDGAKASCAYKIAVALEAALFGLQLGVKEHRGFAEGDGIVGPDAEDTIKNIGRMAKIGMQSTDHEILQIMLEN